MTTEAGRYSVVCCRAIIVGAVTAEICRGSLVVESGVALPAPECVLCIFSTTLQGLGRSVAGSPGAPGKVACGRLARDPAMHGTARQGRRKQAAVVPLSPEESP
jgi:hypothetical protein